MDGFEGRIPCIYLDTNGVPTCGKGHALFSQADALLLPWQINGQPATPQQITADYQAVKAAEPGHVWTHYEPLTVCRLADADIDGLCEHDLTVGWSTFLTHFPQAGEYPAPAQQALLEFAINPGPNWPVVRKEGALVWPKLAAAVLANDWATAATQSHRAPPISKERNDYVAGLFKQAAVTA
jgi:hypothetical protein